MSNVKSSGSNYEKVVIDTAVGAEGFFTNPVAQSFKPRNEAYTSKVVLMVRGRGVFTPKLQFKYADDNNWYDSSEEFVLGDVKEINPQIHGIEWRFGIKSGNFTSGTAILNIIW